MTETIRLNTPCAEGAAVRLTDSAVRRGEGETHVYFEPCQESRVVAIEDACDNDSAMGRTLDVEMTLRDVCPHRRVAVGMELSEVDGDGREHSCGFRAVTVPAHHQSGLCDLGVERVRFILPESAREGRGLCSGRRHFVLRTTNHYMDSNAVR